MLGDGAEGAGECRLPQPVADGKRAAVGAKEDMRRLRIGGESLRRHHHEFFGFSRGRRRRDSVRRDQQKRDGEQRAGQARTCVTPIMSPARTRAASRSASQPSVPAGRSGSTIQR